MRPNQAPKKGASRLVRTIRSLIYICLLGVVLAVYNAVTLHRDVGLAVGPAGSAQEQFFRDASERPDITTFFKNLTPRGRMAMANNIGRYSDRELAKLCGSCLESFDTAARGALTKSLGVVAKVHPDAVAELLNLPGSFQQLAIATALREAGPAALPLVAKQFAVADARPNAIAFLVASGPPAIDATIPYLDDKNNDVRQAAADTLGKLKAKPALPKLIELYNKSSEGDRLGYLTALAGIGDPSTEGLMTKNLSDESVPGPHRAQAALGLGAIGTPTALRTLWGFADAPNKDLRESTISALQLAGDPALRIGTTLKGPQGEEVLTVAAGVHSAYADSIVHDAILVARPSDAAARAAASRPNLTPVLVEEARRLDANSQGDVIDPLLRSLATTPEGRKALEALGAVKPMTPLGALAVRRLNLRHG